MAQNPLYNQQWYLKNIVQKSYAALTAKLGVDINIVQTHVQEVTGYGVLVQVVDTGLDIYHEDLNVSAKNSCNFIGATSGNCTDNNPTPYGNGSDHGTMVSGIIGMRDDKYCWGSGSCTKGNHFRV